MKIGLCYDTRESRGYDRINIQCCSYPSQKTVNSIANLITQSGFEVCMLGSPKELSKSLESKDFDLAFPMISCSNGRGQQIWLPATFELYNIPFVGSDARSILLSSDKYLTSFAAEKHDVASIVSTILIDSSGNQQKIGRQLSFPGIVKPNYGSDSKGVWLVNDEREMWLRANENWSVYKDKIIFQPYLPGTEITVSLCEINSQPIVLGMTETIDTCGKPLPLYTYEHKHIYRCQKRRPHISSSTYDTVSRNAKIMFKALGCHDYARMDFRMDIDGTPHLLEATLAPSLPLSASFFMGGILYGITPSEVMHHIITSAEQRYGLRL